MATQPDPIREWREQYARRILRVDFEPSPDSGFHASVKPIFRELRLVRAALSPGFLFATKICFKMGSRQTASRFVVAQSGKSLQGIWGARFGSPLAMRR